MNKQQVNKEMVQELRSIIFQFENERWLKMATTTDMAKYIIARGFCPSNEKKKYIKCLNRISEILEKHYDDEYEIVDKKGIEKIKQAIEECVGGNNAN